MPKIEEFVAIARQKGRHGELLQKIRDISAKNPKKCRARSCKAIRSAKTIACRVRGCSRPQDFSKNGENTALLRLRAAEACLALRDLEQLGCPKSGSIGGHRQQRQAIKNKIRSCKNKCSPNTISVYPF